MVNEERFWSKVEKTSGCWFWRGYVETTGYGAVGLPQRKKGYAHRVAYELEVGPIPDGLTIDHLCRVRNCVNPAHLEVVTHRENILRGEGTAARHARQTHCHRGHEFDQANTRFRSNGRRECRACHRERERRRRVAA